MPTSPTSLNSENHSQIDHRHTPDAVPDHLRRYAELLEDCDAFVQAAMKPLPRVIWENPLRPLEDEALFARTEAEPVSWRARTWRLPTESKPGAWPEFFLGSIHCQEEAALLAGDLLGALPGEKILDLCAAPGGKTAQIAVAMQDKGMLVANEKTLGRLPSLRRTLDRLGVTCAEVTWADGARLRYPAAFFDRVLADVPCTCEGTSRKAMGRREPTDEGYRASVVQTQRALLRAAIRMCKPGGVILYSTCTYAPEENEGVLTAMGDTVVVEKVDLPQGLKASPGVTSFQGRVFRQDAVNAVRLWPHISDTGGFFVAKLRRL